MNYFTGAILCFVIVICAFIASILLNQSHTTQVFNYDKLSVQLCKSKSIAVYVLSNLINRSSKELFDNTTAEIDKIDFGKKFLEFQLGAQDVETSLNLNDYKSIILYRNVLYKDALLEKVLYKYAITEGRVSNCPPSQCSSKLINQKIRQNTVHPNMYSFTFVRNPLSRFISGVTEVEYRMSYGHTERKLALVGFKFKRGDPRRFQEFVRMVAYMAGKGPIFHNMMEVQLEHIAPQVGTILSMCNSSGSALGVSIEDLNLFKLEDFSNEWDRLVNKSGYESLSRAYSKLTPKFYSIRHPTSSDPLNTTYAAKTFLSYASDDAFTLMSGSTLQSDRLHVPREFEYDQDAYSILAKTYLRAICRIYLVDYICTGYRLPEDCSDLLLELATTLNYDLEKVTFVDIAGKLRSHVCCNLSLVVLIQQEQLYKADNSLRIPEEKLPVIQYNTTYLENFYHFNFGSTDLEVPFTSPENKSYDGISYQRIFKNGNDYIRMLLFKHAFALDGGMSKTFYCVAMQCQHERVHEIAPFELSRYYPSPNRKRYPFTFVQHPIDRVIQTIAKLETNEYRNPFVGNFSKTFELHVENLLRNNLSAGNMSYFASFFSSYFMAKEVEGQDLHVYRVEKIRSEFERLSYDTAIPFLHAAFEGLYENIGPLNLTAFNVLRDAFHSETTGILNYSAPCHATSVAVGAVNHCVRNSQFVAYYWPTSVGGGQSKLVCLSVRHLRALCRLYLFDFVYANYSLPSYCLGDVLKDADQLVQEYYSVAQKETEKVQGSAYLTAAVKAMKILREWLPESLLHALAVLLCWRALTPTCKSEFVYGPNVLEDDGIY